MTWSAIPGRMAFGWIYDEWLASAPRRGARVVEVGVALGKSLAYLCEQLALQDRSDIEVWAVDPWAGYAQNGEQVSMSLDAGGDFSLYTKWMLAQAPKAFERIRVLRLRSNEAAWYFSEGGTDLVILDAAHDYRSVHEDINLWRGTLNREGWIGGDDHEVEFPGVEQACREFFGDPGKGYEVRREQNWGTWLKRYS